MSHVIEDTQMLLVILFKFGVIFIVLLADELTVYRSFFQSLVHYLSLPEFRHLSQNFHNWRQELCGWILSLSPGYAVQNDRTRALFNE